MEKLFMLLVFPLAWPFVARRIWSKTISWQEMLAQIVICSLLVFATWQLGKYGATADVEVWNGSIVSKERNHGHYLRSYSCNCIQQCSGTGQNRTCTQVCQTCFEDHYTVTWSAKSTVGSIRFAHLDRTSRSVYKSPDPQAYKDCEVGEPASLERGYTNWVKAVPESLFNQETALLAKFEDQIPGYPRVHGFYKMNRVLGVDAVGIVPDTISALNDTLNRALIHLGHEKEANIILIVTSITDPAYRHAVETAWLGGKKNDIVIFIGWDGQMIVWADVMTWALNTGNELFHVKMRDGIKEINSLDADVLVPFIVEMIRKHFDRPHMDTFQYLEDAIEPPVWAITMAVILGIGGSIGLTVFFRRVDLV